MKTSDEVLNVASYELINSLKDIAEDAERNHNPDLADSANVALQSVLCVRDAVKRNGEPLFRWTMVVELCAKHIERRFGS